MYAELHCKTNFSFLEGASHPDELVQRAAELGYAALAVTDRESLAGIVRAHGAAKDLGLKLLIGAELHPTDAPPLVVWATDRASYGRLSRLLTVGRRRAEKGKCQLTLADIAEHADGLLAGVIISPAPSPRYSGERVGVRGSSGVDSLGEPTSPGYQRNEEAKSIPLQPLTPALSPEYRGEGEEALHVYRDIFGDRAYLLAELIRGPADAEHLESLASLSKRTKLPLVAAGDVHYHIAARQPLHEVLTAIRLGTTVDRLAEHRFSNAQRHLRSLEEIEEVYRDQRAAVHRTLEIVQRCNFSLSELRYEYPEELVPPGHTPLEFLAQKAWEGAHHRYPEGIPEKVRHLIEHELRLIEQLKYEAYFLTVWDLVRFARQRGILCQGRGSAANSVVCYCLEVTSVNPDQIQVLFERFVSAERNEAPDIDVDFEHERREEVLQYLYNKYGRERAGMTAVVITYRTRSAVRDVGKALGLSLDRVDALAKHMEGRELSGMISTPPKTDKHEDPTPPGEQPRQRPVGPSPLQIFTQRCEESGIDPRDPLGTRLIYLVHQLLGFPRHLSQHVGGMVITRGPLCELSPIENAAMPGRTVIQWDKDDLDELGILKVDCLCLGMLTAIRKCFAMVEQHYGRSCSLATLPQDDQQVYDMICQADTIGVFQIESRAQMSMLPRLLPRKYYDLVIEVAIVRPGPIQGNMVHPYLRRKKGEEPVPAYPTPEIEAVLERTLGVPLFQEQAMQLAVVAAGFTPGEADQLRRAMGAWRRPGIIDQFHKKLIDGMLAKGLSGEFAERVFQQIRGFGEYGFPESHAASFALLVYVSAWLKCYYPAAFCASIINSQPMGFYAPAQLIRDARAHNVRVLPVDVNASDWDCTLEPFVGVPPLGGASPPKGGTPTCGTPTEFALRMGFRMLCGISRTAVDRLVAARQQGPFQSVADLTLRAKLSQAVLSRLAEADVFGSLTLDRRAALWQALSQEKSPRSTPLLDGLDDDEPLAELPPMPLSEQVFADYRTSGMSLKAHPVSFFRRELSQRRVTPAGQLEQIQNGRHLRVAGIVLLRQRPGTARGITFVTLEDETGLANLVIRPEIWERYYAIARRSPAWIAHGKLEKKDGVIHLVASRLEDFSAQLGELKTHSRDFH